MFEKIIIPFDFSDDSYYVVKCLQNLPGVREVILLHVIRSVQMNMRSDWVNPDVDYARLRLEEVRKAIEFPRSRIHAIIEEISGENIAEVIIRRAKAEAPSVIMMGRRGKGVIETLILGSVASDLLRYGTTSLMLVHPPDTTDLMPPYRTTRCPLICSHVLICADFSEPDPVSLIINGSSAWGRVTLLHVVDSGDSDAEVQVAKNLAAARLSQMEQQIAGQSIPVSSQVRVGDAAKEILACSEQEEVSMIVLKSTGKRGILSGILGNTADTIARSSKKPVYIIRSHSATNGDEDKHTGGDGLP